MGTYFGTDGIRGVAGELLTPEFAVQVGRAAAVVLAQKAGPHPLFVIGRDTRLSGPMLEAALTAGLTSGGARVEIAGVIPTPGLATLVHQRGADAGVVISASHNPFADNGIKFFSGAGVKLSDEEEGRDRGAHRAPRSAVARRRPVRLRRVPGGSSRGLRAGRRASHPAGSQRHEDRP